MKIVLELVFEVDRVPCSLGFWPKRGAYDALQVLVDESWWGCRWVVEADIATCFSAVPQEKLMHAIEERVCDQSVFTLLRVILRAGVMEDGQVRRPVTGAPQGGVISPVLCNVYLHRSDRVWDVREHGVLVCFADDVLVMCKSREQAEAVLARLRMLLAERGLEPKEAKTRIVCAPRARRERWNVGREPRLMCCCVEDEGLLALRRRPSGDGVKPPHAALVEDRRGER